MLKNNPRKTEKNDGMMSHAYTFFERIWRGSVFGQKGGDLDMVFIWVPKTAGTSVFTFLNDRVGMKKLKTAKQAMSFENRGAVTFGHQHYLSLLEAGIVSRDFHRRAFNFAFARNPYSRVASLYNYLTQRNLLDAHDFDYFLDEIWYRPPIGLYNMHGLSIANPITDWLMGDEGKLIVDKVFKMEKMKDFERCLAEHCNLQFDVREQWNKSVPVISTKEITGHSERVEKVNRIYERDFKVLGYEMIDPL